MRFLYLPVTSLVRGVHGWSYLTPPPPPPSFSCRFFLNHHILFLDSPPPPPMTENSSCSQFFPVTLDRPDMSGKTEVCLAKYPATSDLQCGYFFGHFFSFLGLARWESVIDHLLSGEISFGLVKLSSLQDLLSSGILTLLGKTVLYWKDPSTHVILVCWCYFS